MGWGHEHHDSAASDAHPAACLQYGEQCSTIPGHALYGAFWPAVFAGLAALVRPRARWTYARLWAVFVQWGAQLTLGALILSGA
ncbi:hypothetical protein [Streptomyces sp. NPDC052107]|uniref:hypothetical protein n=1 Tax=Streptomyces sp. NPDC052107 TaxID=3155632 RepID=UPI003424359B